MKAYSTDLREKIALAYEHNDYTLDEVAELFDVGRRTVARFVQKQRAGLSLAPQPHAGGHPSALSRESLVALRDKVAETPDATLSELASYLKAEAHVSVHLSTVCRALQRLGLPRKKRRWLPPREMTRNAKPSGNGWREWTVANSSLPMRRAFIWRSLAAMDAQRVGHAWLVPCPSIAGRTIR